MKKWVDVSEHQKTIDWQKVKKAGISGAVIRAGYGKNNIDKYAARNIKNALAAGLTVQIYWFSYAYTQEMAKREAEYCVSVIKPYFNKTTVYFDWEYDSMDYAKRKGIHGTKSYWKNLITQLTICFCERVKQLGYIPGVYYNLDYRKNYYDLDRVSGYTQWLADYVAPMSYPCDLWQYSSKGRVSGISGNCDVNYVVKSGSGLESKSVKAKKEVCAVQIEVPVLREGDSGVWVGNVQWATHVKPLDFDFGPSTTKAVKAFQKEHSLAEDGIVGSKTWEKIMAELSKD